MRTRYNAMKSRAFIVLVVVVAGGLLSVAPRANHAIAEQLRVGGSEDLKCALLYIADSRGFFRNRGLEVVLGKYEAGSMAVDDLMRDKLDIAIASEIVFILRSFRRPDLRITGTICVASDVELVFRKDRGIMKPQDLKGKSIAVTRGTGGEFFLHTYFLFNDIPIGSVHVVDLKPSEMVNAIADGTIDAALCWPPYTTDMAERLRANGDRRPAQSGQDYYFTLIMKEGSVKRQPKKVEQFIAALREAEEFVVKHPDQAQTLLRKRLGVDQASFLEMWSSIRFQLQLSQDLLVLMELEAKWAIRNKLVDGSGMPNYLDFFYFDALDKVKPEAVSIVH